MNSKVLDTSSSESVIQVPQAKIRKTTRRDVHLGDRIFSGSLTVLVLGILVLIGAIAWELFRVSLPTLNEFGLKFLVSSEWDPVAEHYGAWSFIYGTVVSSLLSLIIAVPISVGAALFLTEIANRKVATAFGFLVEMLAAIPSVVYGLWGIFVLAPWIRSYVGPALENTLGFLPLFKGPIYGVGMFTAGVILAIMITPTISAICREVFRSVPIHQREAALGLGATRWEMISISVLKSSRTGIFGAVILGLGRALGETMAVTMVIGNRAEISASLFAPAQTMASLIANEYAEATSDLHLSALAMVGFSLFLVSLVINALARGVLWRMNRNQKGAIQ